MKMINEISKAIGCKKTQQILRLINDLDFDYDRMSESGQETYDKLLLILGFEE